MQDNFTPNKNIMNLVDAISGKESNYGKNTKSKLSEQEGSYGVLQYTPARFNEDAAKYLPKAKLDINSDRDQKILKYFEIENLINKGYSLDEIVAGHNMGMGNVKNWQTKVGVNKYGNKYDVPAYVAEVKQNYQNLVRQGADPTKPKEKINVFGSAAKGLGNTLEAIVTDPLGTAGNMIRTTATNLANVGNTVGSLGTAAGTTIADYTKGSDNSLLKAFQNNYKKNYQKEIQNINQTGLNYWDRPYGSPIVNALGKIDPQIAEKSKEYYQPNVSDLTNRADLRKFAAQTAEGVLDVALAGKGGSIFKSAKGTVKEIAKNAGIETFKNTTKKGFLKNAANLGKVVLGTGGIGSAYGLLGTLQTENPTVAGAINNTSAGLGGGAGLGVLGGLAAKTLKVGVGATSKTYKNVFEKNKTKQANLDYDIKNIYQKNGVTDVKQIKEKGQNLKNGLAIITKPKEPIIIQNINDPLIGAKTSGTTKVYSFENKPLPNETLSAIKTMKDTVVVEARKVAEESARRGYTINTEPAFEVLDKYAKGEQVKGLLETETSALAATGGNPIQIFDWIEGVNNRYRGTYESAKAGRGTPLKDARTATILIEMAEKLRQEMDIPTQRTSYANSMAGLNETLSAFTQAITESLTKKDLEKIKRSAGVDMGFAPLFSDPTFILKSAASKIFNAVMSRKSFIKKYNELMGIADTIRKSDYTFEIPSVDRMPPIETPLRTNIQSKISPTVETPQTISPQSTPAVSPDMQSLLDNRFR